MCQGTEILLLCSAVYRIQNSYQLRCLSTLGFDRCCFDHLHKSNIQPSASWEFNPKACARLLGTWRVAAQILFREISCTICSICSPTPLLCNSLIYRIPFLESSPLQPAFPTLVLVRMLLAPHPFHGSICWVYLGQGTAHSISLHVWGFSYQAHSSGNDFIPPIIFWF